MIQARAQRKSLHTCITVITVKHHLAEIDRIDGPIEYLSQILAAFKFEVFFFLRWGSLLDGALVRHPHAVEKRFPDLEVVVMVEVVLVLGLGVKR